MIRSIKEKRDQRIRGLYTPPCAALSAGRRALRLYAHRDFGQVLLLISSAIFVLKERLVPVFGGFRVRGVQIWGSFFN